MPFVVESPIVSTDGKRSGTARVYVATEERAKEIATAHHERTYREIALEDMPAAARDNLVRAHVDDPR